MKLIFFALLLSLTMLFTSCAENQGGNNVVIGGPGGGNHGNTNKGEVEKPGVSADLGGDDQTFGDSFDDLGIYDGLPEDTASEIEIICLSGTPLAYKIQGSTISFTEISQDSEYSVSGSFNGNIIIDVGDSYKLSLELHGFSLACSTTNPITILSGSKVEIKAKKDTKNYIYDTREAIDETNENLYSGAVHSIVDLEIGGKGELTVVSENNNGIHSKDDLEIKNLTLYVACVDNSLKGNDSVTIEGGSTVLIATGGDCIKTVSSDISEKANQRGTVTVNGGTHSLYAACDGIDAAYNVAVDDSTTVLSIYTDKYSNYSEDVTTSSSDINYIRYTSKKYYYSVKYYNSDSDYLWVNAEYHSTVSGGRTSYYYYSYSTVAGYEKQQFFIYENESQRGQDQVYYLKTDYLTPNSASDTFALSQSYNGFNYQWTNYTTSVQGPGSFGGPGGMGGPGGFGEGNSDKGDYSTKGIKAANEILINAGTINIKSYDVAIHANNNSTLENGASALGNVTINGGTVTVYSNDDGIHADGILFIKSGTVSVTNSYEGVEGTQVKISGGYLSINSKDDGINATASSGTAIEISGGDVYIYCTGDGIDSNSRTSYQGIVFSGGRTVVISNSNGNSAIDTEQGYTYTGGSVIAIMSRGGMTSETTHAQNFSSIGKSTQLSLSKGDYLVVGIGNSTATVKIPVSISAIIVVLGSNSPDVATSVSTSQTLDENGVCWK